MDDDTKTARVAYLRLLKDEFNRSWPYGHVRSSEPGERAAFDAATRKIADLTRRIEEDLA